MATRTITAIYDSEADAQFAREQLLSTGLDDDDVRVVSQNLSSSTVGTDTGHDKGMWESIKDFFVGEDDRPIYSEGLRRGGFLLTARVDDDHSDEAISTLEQTNAIDLDERAEQWRSEGWAEMDTSSEGSMAETSGFEQGMPIEGRMSDEQAIPLAEERLRVGKREVERGGVRVRSYVVEEPVHEQVSLREERVDVERRSVGERVAGTDDELFREQTIELSERGEEPVISKDAVVTEEVVVSKADEEHVEDIDETLRHTEVDVDDSRTSKRNRASSRSGTRKRR